MSKDKNALDQRAISILQGNDRGGYTVPTHGLYPYQWNWDSAFVALGFAVFDPDRALRELETLFEGQWRNGMLPHIIFRADDPDYFPGPGVWRTGTRPPSSGISQPPVVASIVWRLWERWAEGPQRARLKGLFPKLLALHRWFHSARDPGGQGVVVATHPWESGRDNSPEWDAPLAAVDTSGVEPYRRRDLKHVNAAMRPTAAQYDGYVALVEYGREQGWDTLKIAREGPFRMADVGLSFILLRADRDLLRLAQVLGDERAAAEIQAWIERGLAGVEQLWDPAADTFCSWDLITGRASGQLTSASFLYAYADAGTDAQRQRMQGHWQRIAEQVRFTLPSFDPDESAFDPACYWRGPCWAVVNHMVARGFAEQGQGEAAARIKADTRRLIATHGFAEAFDPVAGTASGGGEFSWTAAMWLAWAGVDATDEEQQ
ncbi:MAG: hypothetical protein GDA55_02950 [Cellvibrionales bacterium]|nr:hypothetical protein [Cellvibrionales bacterium]